MGGALPAQVAVICRGRDEHPQFSSTQDEPGVGTHQGGGKGVSWEKRLESSVVECQRAIRWIHMPQSQPTPLTQGSYGIAGAMEESWSAASRARTKGANKGSKQRILKWRELEQLY